MFHYLKIKKKTLNSINTYSICYKFEEFKYNFTILTQIKLKHSQLIVTKNQEKRPIN